MRGTLVVWGLLANSPFGGMTWQVLHHLEGFRRLGFDVWYVEDSDAPLQRPEDLEMAETPDANVAWMARRLEAIGMGERWMLRAPWSEEVHGGSPERLARLYREADAVFNLCGSHWVLDRHEEIERLVLLETDPVSLQVHLANGADGLDDQLRRYSHLFTYGANLGTDGCAVPDAGYDWRPTRPPVVVDWWRDGDVPPRDALTTVASWGDHGAEKDVSYGGETYTWRKDLAFRPFLDLPSRSALPLELALALIGDDEAAELRARGWRTASAAQLLDPDAYRAYIRGSRGELTAAKDQYVRTGSGWFSDRSACYLAAGRPVITQDTGFARNLPAGEGLFAFATEDDAVAAIERVALEPERHARAAAEIAREHFDAERVLGEVLETMGLL